MTDDQMRKALDCCCCSDCAECVLSQYKFDDEHHAKFICMVAESSWRKNLCMALKKPSWEIQKCFQANLLRRCVKRVWYSSQNVYNSPVDNRAGICYNIGKVESTNNLIGVQQ